jgi:hypothetical protein
MELHHLPTSQAELNLTNLFLDKDLRAEAGYFEHNQRRMQYLEMREAGFPIGSGMVESGGKQFRARLVVRSISNL